MAKKAAAPANTDEFIKWVQSVLPDQVRLFAHASFSFHRDGGYVRQSYELHLDVTKGEHSLSKASHDFRVLANWLVDVALPTLCPPPQRVLRKITVVRPALEYHPPEKLFD